MIAEQVERTPLRDGTREDAILALVEERAGLLPGVRCGEVTHAVLPYLDLARERRRRAARRAAREPFARPHRRIVAGEDPLGAGERRDGIRDLVTERLESGREQLHDDPAVEAIGDQRRKAVALAVHEAVRVGFLRRRGSRLAIGAGDPRVPPALADRRVGVAVEQPKRDLGRRAPERPAE